MALTSRSPSSSSTANPSSMTASHRRPPSTCSRQLRRDAWWSGSRGRATTRSLRCALRTGADASPSCGEQCAGNAQTPQTRHRRCCRRECLREPLCDVGTCHRKIVPLGQRRRRRYQCGVQPQPHPYRIDRRARHRPPKALHRHAQSPLDDMQRIDVTVAREFQERARRRQPDIAGAHRIAAITFRIIEKGQDQRLRDVPQAHRHGLLVQVHHREVQEQHDRVAAGRHRPWARRTLLHKVLGEEQVLETSTWPR